MKPYGYVYLTINTLTGARYVGQRRGAFNPDYLGSGKLLIRSVEKYGRDAFTVERLQSAKEQKELNALEILYIREQRELYPVAQVLNIADGGLFTNIDGKPFMTGRKHSAATRAKMSSSSHHTAKPLPGALNGMFGRTHSPEARRLIGEKNSAIRGSDHGNFGKVRSAETRAKISAGKMGQVSRKGWKMSDEHKAKISATRKAKFAAGFKMEYSAETRLKISEGRKRYWAKIKEETCA